MLENIFQIHYLGKEPCAEFGQLGIMMHTFRLERIDNSAVSSVNIKYQLLLPSSTEEYINWKKALEILEMSEVSKTKLEELCNEGIIEYITDGKVWYIKKESLDKYIQGLEKNM